MLWWESLSSLGKVFACIAVPFSVVMLIQTILLIFGFGSDDATGSAGLDHDFSGGHDAMGHDFSGGHDALGHDLSGGHDAGMDAAHNGHGVHSESADLRLFSIRGIISFMVVLGWIGLILNGRMANALTIAIALAAGFGALYLTAKIFQWSKKLQSSGNIDMKNAVGTEAQVYLTIPAAMSGKGKIQVIIQGRLVDCDAVTQHDRPLPTGSSVVVTGVRPDNTLIAEPK